MHFLPGFARPLVGIALLSASWTAASAAPEPEEKPVKSQPLKIFILVGQSNMLGHAEVRTFEHIGMDPATQPLLESMVTAEGEPRTSERVRIAAVGGSDEERLGPLTAGYGATGGKGPKIGPEFAFGLTLEDRLEGPVLLIKTAWGGKSLHTDFRPPSAGPYIYRDVQIEWLESRGRSVKEEKADRIERTGQHYRMMINYVEGVLLDLPRVHPDYDPEVGYELVGLVWFQGWNDMVDTGTYPNRGEKNGYFAYSDLLARLIKDVRLDLGAPDLPVVVGVMGVGGPTEDYGPRQKRNQFIHQNFRDAMAAPAELPEFDGNVANVYTEHYWDPELTRLRALNDLVNQHKRELESKGTFSSRERDFLVDAYRAEVLTPEERETLAKGVSNAEYHYLGSAKIMAQIGRGFAEAMLELIREEDAGE